MKRYPLAPALLLRRRETEESALSAGQAAGDRARAEERLSEARTRTRALEVHLETALAVERTRDAGGATRALDWAHRESFVAAVEERLGSLRERERAAERGLAEAARAEERARAVLAESRGLERALGNHEEQLARHLSRDADERETEDAVPHGLRRSLSR